MTRGQAETWMLYTGAILWIIGAALMLIALRMAQVDLWHAQERRNEIQFQWFRDRGML